MMLNVQNWSRFFLVCHICMVSLIVCLRFCSLYKLNWLAKLGQFGNSLLVIIFLILKSTKSWFVTSILSVIKIQSTNLPLYSKFGPLLRERLASCTKRNFDKFSQNISVHFRNKIVIQVYFRPTLHMLPLGLNLSHLFNYSILKKYFYDLLLLQELIFHAFRSEPS